MSNDAQSVLPPERMVNPKLIIALGVVIALVVFIRFLNPHREYSSTEYWQAATVESVASVPEAALAPGNKNGSVLMWAAMTTSDPQVIEALVARGADVNESDPVFLGTPLSAAAGYSKHPHIIDELIRLGADVRKRVGNEETALMVAAQYNTTPGIVETLIAHGADPAATNAQGKTALDLARQKRNAVTEAALLRAPH